MESQEKEFLEKILDDEKLLWNEFFYLINLS